MNSDAKILDIDLKRNFRIERTAILRGIVVFVFCARNVYHFLGVNMFLACLTTFMLVGTLGMADAATTGKKSDSGRAANPMASKRETGSKTATASTATGKLENYQDLIEKARNLSLQRDRLQASQILLRGLEREAKNSNAYRELVRAHDELTSVFYTERAQALYSQADSMLANKPKEAVEPLLEALRLEDGNVSVLRLLIRVQLVLGECDRADTYLTSSETLALQQAENKLLRLQTLDCMKKTDEVAKFLSANRDAEFEDFVRFVRPYQIKEAIRVRDFKKAKALLVNWEQIAPDQPEVQFWKWNLSASFEPGAVPDRAAGRRYVQACQKLTPRKRKSYIYDVDLCKSVGRVEESLKSLSGNEI